MGKRTGIGWTRSSLNPWIGCTEVSPGCNACYARELDARHKYGGGTHWGAGVPRYRTNEEANRKKAMEWNTIARMEVDRGTIQDGSDWTMPGFYPVFPSMCDPFDNEVPEEWRLAFLDLVLRTKYLTWLLLTKRIGNAAEMLRTAIGENAAPNIWIGASVVNQAEVDRDLPKLIRVPAVRRFVSYEPALGPVNLTPHLWKPKAGVSGLPSNHDMTNPTFSEPAGLIHQVIVGGESRQGKHVPRVFRREWASSVAGQCRDAKTAFFMKQMGAFVVDRNDAGFEGEHGEQWPANTVTEDSEPYQGADCRVRLVDRAGADPKEWPEKLRLQQFPT